MTESIFKNCLKWMQKNLEWQCHAKGHDCPKAHVSRLPKIDGAITALQARGSALAPVRSRVRLASARVDASRGAFDSPASTLVEGSFVSLDRQIDVAPRRASRKSKCLVSFRNMTSSRI